jgi:hypothetical protein
MDEAIRVVFTVAALCLRLSRPGRLHRLLSFKEHSRPDAIVPVEFLSLETSIIVMEDDGNCIVAKTSNDRNVLIRSHHRPSLYACDSCVQQMGSIKAEYSEFFRISYESSFSLHYLNNSLCIFA